jgi:hypothetical protein
MGYLKKLAIASQLANTEPYPWSELQARAGRRFLIRDGETLDFMGTLEDAWIEIPTTREPLRFIATVMDIEKTCQTRRP